MLQDKQTAASLKSRQVDSRSLVFDTRVSHYSGGRSPAQPVRTRRPADHVRFAGGTGSVMHQAEHL